MNVRQLLAVVAMMIASSAFAQKSTTWVVPDAGFKSSMTRAEVRNELRTGDRRAWHRRDGEDPIYAAGPQNQTRKDIRAEVARTAHARHVAKPDALYFGD